MRAIVPWFGLLSMASYTNHAAYLRTQAGFLAGAMIERMRANPAAVWQGAYNAANYPLPIRADCSAGCLAGELARHDQQEWSRQLGSFLPEPRGRIQCASPSSGAQALLWPAAHPPFGGLCRLSLSWRRPGDQRHDSLIWEFQP